MHAKVMLRHVMTKMKEISKEHANDILKPLFLFGIGTGMAAVSKTQRCQVACFQATLAKSGIF